MDGTPVIPEYPVHLFIGDVKDREISALKQKVQELEQQNLKWKERFHCVCEEKEFLINNQKEFIFKAIAKLLSTFFIPERVQYFVNEMKQSEFITKEFDSTSLSNSSKSLSIDYCNDESENNPQEENFVQCYEEDGRELKIPEASEELDPLCNSHPVSVTPEPDPADRIPVIVTIVEDKSNIDMNIDEFEDNRNLKRTRDDRDTYNLRTQIMKCKKCAIKFDDADLYKEHVNSHVKIKSQKSRTYTCQFCTATFSIPKDHKNHMQKFHCNYKCPDCTAKFCFDVEYQNHVTEVHKYAKCSKCKKVLKDVVALNYHMRIHSENSSQYVPINRT